MKSLTLLRHAKSSWDDGVTRDFDRPLNAKGRRAAVTMGRHMATLAPFDLVLASSARRVVETIAGIEEGLGRPLSSVSEDRLYLASVSTLCDLIHAAPPEATRLLIVGHNSGLEDLALTLARADDPLRATVFEKYPTATLCALTWPGDWRAAAEGIARIAAFTRPRDLDAALGPDED